LLKDSLIPSTKYSLIPSTKYSLIPSTKYFYKLKKGFVRKIRIKTHEEN